MFILKIEIIEISRNEKKLFHIKDGGVNEIKLSNKSYDAGAEGLKYLNDYLERTGFKFINATQSVFNNYIHDLFYIAKE